MLSLAVVLTGCSAQSNEETLQKSETAAAVSNETAEENTQSSSDSMSTQENSSVTDSEESEENQVSQQFTDSDGGVSQEIFAMDTYMVLKAYGSQASEAVTAGINEIQRLDALLSTGSPDSEVSRLNAEGGGTLASDTEYLIQRSLALFAETDGAFDISIYPVMKLWGFSDDSFAVPDPDELKERLKLVDAAEIRLDGEKHAVQYQADGLEIDLGGIAKGYTSARIARIFESYGIKSGLLNLGGNVQAIGTKTDGTDWKVGIQNPEGDGTLGILQISDQAVITSGGYERFFEEGGKTYHHIIDPSTGYPAENGILSSTIVSSDGTLADGLSTSLYIMGLDKAVSFWREHSESFDFILVDDKGGIYVTEGLKDSFSCDGTVTVISSNE